MLAAKNIQRPLVGKTVVITRQESQSQTMSFHLQALGAETIHWPMIQVTPLYIAKPDLDLANYDWIVFASANAVRYFAPHLIGADFSGQIATVGPKTAEALNKLGVPLDVMPQKFQAESLVESLGNPNGLNILLPRSASGRPELIDGLAAAGAIVSTLNVYDTTPVVYEGNDLELIRHHLLDQSSVNVIAFASPSAVYGWRDCLQKLGINKMPSHIIVACIGPTTAATANEVGLSVTVIPEDHTAAAMVNAIAAYFS